MSLKENRSQAPQACYSEGHCRAGPGELITGFRGWGWGAGGVGAIPIGSLEGQTQAGSCRGPGSNPTSVNYLLCDLG